MPEQQPSLELVKIGVAVVLTCIADYVDAVGWLSLDRVFIAQMSGNMVLLAVHLAAGEEVHVWLQVDAIAAFFAGLVVTGSVIEIGMRRRFRRIFIVALTVEFVMLAGFAVAATLLRPALLSDAAQADWPAYGLIAVVAFAMGAQNTSMRMAKILPVFTTHMTGAMTGLSEEIIVSAISLLDPDTPDPDAGVATGRRRSVRSGAIGNILRSAALLLGFFAGALGGAVMAHRLGAGPAIIVPLGLLVGVGVFAWMVPLTVFSAPEAQK